MACQPDYNAFTYSAVAVFGPGQTEEAATGSFTFPINLRPAMQAIFDDAAHTQVVPGALAVTAMIPPEPGGVMKSAEFGVGKLQAVSGGMDVTAGVIVRLYGLLLESNPTICNVAYGLNYEFEFAVPGVENSGLWLAQHCVAAGLRLPDGWKASGAEVKFGLKGRDGLLRHVHLQQCANRLNWFFASVNNHFEPFGDLDPRDQAHWARDLKSVFDETRRFVVELVTASARPQPSRKRKHG